MKQKLFFSSFIVTLLTIAACTKDPSLLPVPATRTVPQPDTIVYSDITDISLLSDSMLHPSGCGIIPFPSDTLYTDSLDLDQDGTYDIKFENTHYYYFLSASVPCVNYNCKINTHMLNTADSIALHPVDLWWIDAKNLHDTIDNQLTYNYLSGNIPLISLHTNTGFVPYTAHNFVGEAYIPFKLHRGSKYMFGWLRIESTNFNGIIIKDYAINKTDSNPIAAGQQH